MRAYKKRTVHRGGFQIVSFLGLVYFPKNGVVSRAGGQCVGVGVGVGVWVGG